MMKQKAFTLFILFCLANGILFALLWLNHREIKNGFVRTFPPHVIGDYQYRDLGFNTFHIAGVDHDTLIIGNYDAPLYVLKYSLTTRDTLSQLIHLPDSLVGKLRRPQLNYSGKNLFLTDGLTSSVMKISKGKGTVNYQQYAEVNTFSAIQIADSNKITVRTYDAALAQHVLVNLDKESGRVVETFPLDKLQEGLFSTDGILLHNENQNLLIYVHYYRNNIAILDTQLQIRQRAATLDTVRTGKIRTTFSKEKNELSLKDPLLIVNTNAYTSEKWLYIHSGLRADNEGKEPHPNSVIDVYSLPSAEYKFSFYVPDYQNKKVSSFMIYGDRLFAIQGQYLCSYRFDPSSFRGNISKNDEE